MYLYYHLFSIFNYIKPEVGLIVSWTKHVLS